LKKIIDDTTGLALSLKCAQTYDKKNVEATAAAKAKNLELFPLAPAERQRWVAAFKPMIQKVVEDGEKAGLPARALVGAYGLLS